MEKLLAKLMTEAALIDNHAAFKKDARKHSLGKWVDIHVAKAAAMGGASGWIPFSELVDTPYLVSMVGRLCFGIGYIKGKTVNTNEDMEGILAIWSDSAKAVSVKDLEKRLFSGSYQTTTDSIIEANSKEKLFSFAFLKKIFGFKTNGSQESDKEKHIKQQILTEYIKLLQISNKLLVEDSHLHIKEHVKTALLNRTNSSELYKEKQKHLKKSAKNSGSSAKTMLITSKKISKKITTKILAKSSAKFANKTAGKFASKFIPFVGPVVTAGINIWIIDTFAEAALRYYDSDYIMISNEISQDLTKDIVEHLNRSGIWN